MQKKTQKFPEIFKGNDHTLKELKKIIRYPALKKLYKYIKLEFIKIR